MNSWFYFRNTSYATYEEQEEAAMQNNIDSAYWLGEHHKADFKDCTNVLRLIFNTEDKVHKRERGRHPIRSGDELWVYNIYSLGSDTPKILSCITMIHKAKIGLHIISIRYHDDANAENPVNKDYKIVRDLLTELSKRSAKRTHATKKSQNADEFETTIRKVGRPRVNITLSSLTQSGRNIIEKYCKNPDYSFEKCFEDMRSKKTLATNQTYVISKKTFYSLVREMDNELRSKNMHTFRTNH